MGISMVTILRLLICCAITHNPVTSTNRLSLNSEKSNSEYLVAALLEIRTYLSPDEQCYLHLISKTFSGTDWATDLHLETSATIQQSVISSTSNSITSMEVTSPPRFTFNCAIFFYCEIGDISVQRNAVDIYVFILPSTSASKYCTRVDLKYKFYISFERQKLQSCQSPSAVSRRHVNLKGVHLKISGLTHEPYMIVRDGRTVGGIFVTFFQVASKYYNYTYVLSNDRKGGGRRIIGELVNRTMDVGCPARITYQRRGLVDFTSYVFDENGLFALATPKALARWDALVKPLPAIAWLFLAVSVIVFIPLLYFSMRLQGTQRDSNDVLYRSFMFPLAALVDQEVKLEDGNKILSASWLFFALLIGILYGDRLLLELTFPNLERIPLNLAQVQNRPDFRTIFHYWGSTLIDNFRQKENPMLFTLGKRLELEEDGGICVAQAVSSSRTLCIGMRSFLSVHLAKNATLSAGFRSYKLIENLFSTIYVSIPLQKGSIYTAAWNEVVGRLRDAGLVHKWNDDVLLRYKQQGRKWMLSQNTSESFKVLASTMTNEGSVETPLKVEQVFILFVVHLILLLVCSVGFVWEFKSRIAGSELKSSVMEHRASLYWDCVTQ